MDKSDAAFMEKEREKQTAQREMGRGGRKKDLCIKKEKSKHCKERGVGEREGEG